MKRYNGIISIFMALLLNAAVLLTGCGVNPSATPSLTTSPQPEESQKQEITDRKGNKIALSKEINTIVSIGPAITETLIALGMSEKIIGIDSFSDKFEGLKAGLPIFDMMAIDLEKLISIKPDLVLATEMVMVNGNDPFKLLREGGACIIYIPVSESVNLIKEDIKFLGEVTNTQDKAAKLLTKFDDELEKASALNKQGTVKKRVYFEISAAPAIYSFGTGVFMNELIEMLGAENIFADKDSWISASEEAVIKENPDVILTNVNYIDDPVGEIKNRNGWSSITAVKENQVYYIDKNASSLPNHNIIKALQQMKEALYPGAN